MKKIKKDSDNFWYRELTKICKFLMTFTQVYARPIFWIQNNEIYKELTLYYSLYSWLFSIQLLVSKIVLAIERKFYKFSAFSLDFFWDHWIYSNSKRWEQYLKQNTFLTRFWRLKSDLLHGPIKMPIGTNKWNVEI